MSEPYCAECGNSVPMDMDHVHILASIQHIDDRDDREDYYFHMECWWEVSDDWEVPA